MNLEIIPSISGLLHKYNDKFLADDSLSNVDVLLLSLYLIEKKNQKTGVTYTEIKEIFFSLGRTENNFNVAIHRAKKQNLIEEKEKAFYFLIQGLKQIWKILGKTEKSKVWILKSGEFFTSIKLFEEFIQNEIKDEEMLLFDPYISSNTLYPFSMLKGKLKTIKILTSNIHEEEKFKEYKKKFEKEFSINLQVKKNLKIHDRWLISGEKCWSIGSSIKDLGNKDTTIHELDGVKNSLTELFKFRWDEAEEFN